MPPKHAKSASTNRRNGGDRKEIRADRFKGRLALGNLIWVKLSKNTWWPAQVVDENTISESRKKGTKSKGEVLVRIYGSYRYLYVDPLKCHSDFEKILKQNNDSYRNIFNKSLEQDLLSLHSGKPKSQRSKSTGNVRATSSKKKLSQNSVTENEEQNQEKCAAVDLGPSPRRRRIMQSLGLMAPSGSPFSS